MNILLFNYLNESNNVCWKLFEMNHICAKLFKYFSNDWHKVRIRPALFFFDDFQKHDHTTAAQYAAVVWAVFGNRQNSMRHTVLLQSVCTGWRVQHHDAVHSYDGAHNALTWPPNLDDAAGLWQVQQTLHWCLISARAVTHLLSRGVALVYYCSSSVAKGNIYMHITWSQR